jgi:hypothetical protein
MAKVLISFLLAVTLLNGDILNDKVKNLIGQRDYNIHKNLINLLLKDKYKYENNGQIKYYNLVKMLRENGLLDLHLSYPQEINIEFDLLNKSLKGYKILKDTMESIGYRYFFTDSLSSSENRLNWIIRFRAEYMLNPQILLKELQQKNCKILNIENRGFNSWYYEIDFETSKVDEAVKIDKDEKVVFQKPLKPYFLALDDIKSLQIISRKLNNWFPYIVFFDKDLNILKVIKKDRIYKGFKAKAPSGTKYVKISDTYNLINIKRGLSIIAR